MSIEIERKFLINGPELELWKKLKRDLSSSGLSHIQPFKIEQGYLTNPTDPFAIRIRKMEGPSIFYHNSNKITYILCIKKSISDTCRHEIETEISKDDGEFLLNNALAKVMKDRYKYTVDRVTWEIDEFYGNNAGLVLAEVELKSENQNIVYPHFINPQKEVTQKPEYLNQHLAFHSWDTWG